VRNVKLALRTLFKTPFVTAVAVVSLALGIGANAAIYSLFDEMLLQPLPVREPERLVNVSSEGPRAGSVSCNQAGECDQVFSYPMLRDLEKKQTSFTGIAGHFIFGVNLSFRSQTLNGEGVFVSGSYFPTLALQPALGRLLTPVDDQTIGGHFVTVLSHSYWEAQLGANPAVVNEKIIVNGHPMTIVGIAPRGFEGTTLGTKPKVYVPLSMRGLMTPGFDPGFTNRRSYWVYLFGRLKPGVSMEQATAAINSIYQPIINEVEVPLQEGMSERRLTEFKAKKITLADGPMGQSSVHGETRVPLLLLLSITGIVLLIACANIANLLLARAAGRSLEMAVRLSLGATRRQLLTQLLTESVLLALLGGVVSLLVAHWTLGLIASILPPDFTDTARFGLRLPVVGFAAAMAIGTGLLFGMFPALHSTRPDLVSSLRAGSGKHSGARAAARFRTSLVTAQIALSMLLLISAGLFIKSLRNVSRVDLGLRPDSVVTFGISPELNGYTPVRAKALFERVEDELAAVPGVTMVAATRMRLLSGSNWGSSVVVQGFEAGPDTDVNARFNMIGPGYFRTLGIPLVSGREFTRADNAGSPKVIIVNEAFVKKFNLGRDAIGKRVGTGRRTEHPDMEIVGVIRNAKYSEVKQEVPPQFFTPYRQDTTVGAINFYVRTSRSPQQLMRTIPAVLKSLDPNLPVEDLKSLPQQIRENISLDRMISTLSAAFAALATLLAAVGLYGVLAYTVAQRTREIGVRMALGANEGRVRGMVLKQVGVMTVIGGVIGVAAAFGVGRAAGSLLFELKGHDPVVFVVAAAVLTMVALGAGYIPARRASRVAPMQALRYE
jgi:predicted permease